MFVKVVYENGNSSSLYECKKVNTANLEKDQVMFILDNGAVHIDVHKTDDVEIYIMNNEGKTIDMYRWGTKKGIDG